RSDTAVEPPRPSPPPPRTDCYKPPPPRAPTAPPSRRSFPSAPPSASPRTPTPPKPTPKPPAAHAERTTLPLVRASCRRSFHPPPRSDDMTHHERSRFLPTACAAECQPSDEKPTTPIRLARRPQAPPITPPPSPSPSP